MKKAFITMIAVIAAGAAGIGGYVYATHRAGMEADRALRDFLYDNKLDSKVSYGKVEASPFNLPPLFTPGATIHDLRIADVDGATIDIKALVLDRLRIGEQSAEGIRIRVEGMTAPAVLIAPALGPAVERPQMASYLAVDGIDRIVANGSFELDGSQSDGVLAIRMTFIAPGYSGFHAAIRLASLDPHLFNRQTLAKLGKINAARGLDALALLFSETDFLKELNDYVGRLEIAGLDLAWDDDGLTGKLKAYDQYRLTSLAAGLPKDKRADFLASALTHTAGLPTSDAAKTAKALVDTMFDLSSIRLQAKFDRPVRIGLSGYDWIGGSQQDRLAALKRVVSHAKIVVN